MKAQVSIEFLMNLLIWIAFISIIATVIISAINETKFIENRILNGIKLHEITMEVEQLKAMGNTVGYELGLHKYKNGKMVIESDGKELVEQTIFGVDRIDGQPI